MESINTSPTVEEVKQNLAATIAEIGLLEYPAPHKFYSDITLFPPGDNGYIKANFQIRVTTNGIFYKYGGGEQTLVDFEAKLKEKYPEATLIN